MPETQDSRRSSTTARKAAPRTRKPTRKTASRTPKPTRKAASGARKTASRKTASPTRKPAASAKKSAAAKTRPTPRLDRWKTTLLVLAGIRTLLGIVAIPLAPFLYEKHYLALVLMRPTKEVLLFGGFLVRQGKVNIFEILAAALPLALLGVWHAYALGRAYAGEIKSSKIPGIGSRLIPIEKVKKLQKALRRKGTKLIITGRLAVFPSSILGIAAGSSEVPSKKFIIADTIGGLLSIAEVLGAGYLLGEAYKSGKIWVTVAGVAALAVGGIIMGRTLNREGKSKK